MLELMPLLKLGPLALAGGLLLAACGSRAATGSPSSSPAGAAKPPASSAAAIPSAAVVGQRAPGPFSANGVVNLTDGQGSVEATDTLKWQPNVVLAKPGDKITLQLRNNGNTDHTFISPGLGLNSAQEDAPGKTVPVTFTAPSAPGAYQFWCNIPGHAEAGMVGEVIVQ
jgi:plastocyanin